MFRKNHVGRPSNEELKRRRNKKILLVSIPVVLVGFFSILIATGNLSNIMGNSVIDYYCEDNSYTLDGSDCVKTIAKKPVLLGDLNLDTIIDNTDLDTLKKYIEDVNSIELSKIQLKTADINQDSIVNILDVQILEGYINKDIKIYTNYSKKIGVEKICEDDYTLNGKYCVVYEIIPAIQKEEKSSSEKQEKKEISTKDSIGVKFETQTKGTSAPKGTKYRFNVKFDIKDTANTYYYRWRTYKGEKENFVGGCYKVTSTNEHVKELTIIDAEPRYGTITIYSDSSCANRVNELPVVSTNKYTCSNCAPLEVKVDETLSSSQPQGKVVPITLSFNVIDKTSKYYYRWRTYKADKENFVGGCYEIKPNDKSSKTLTIIDSDTRKGTITVYSDSSCKNKVNTVPVLETTKYTCSNCNNNKITINYNANGGSGTMNTQQKGYDETKNISANKFSRNGYYFIGWRNYNNSKKQWMCYKNSNKSSYGYTQESNCKKYGYLIYRDSQSITHIATSGETITFYALWQYSYKNAKNSFKGFEKDPKGATVWPMVKIDFYKKSNGTSKIGTIPQGYALKVIDMTNKNNSNNSYVKVKYNGKEGYINGWLTLINIPDVMPSVISNITNANASIYKSRKYNLSGITGKDIYGADWKYTMAPIRIDTTKKIQAVSSLALKYGNKLKIYDSFRPWIVQRKIADSVKSSWFTGKWYTITSDFDSSKNTNGPGATYISDSKGWFIAIASSAPSSHNLAKAIDVTLVFSDDNQEIPTQSSMHELSGNSIPTKQQVDSNKGELALNYLFTNNGFMFLPSEWWHFEDNQNAYYGSYNSQIKCLGNPFSSNKYNCKLNQLKLAK